MRNTIYVNETANPNHSVCGHIHDVHGMLSSSSASVYGCVVLAQVSSFAGWVVCVLVILSFCRKDMWNEDIAVYVYALPYGVRVRWTLYAVSTDPRWFNR